MSKKNKKEVDKSSLADDQQDKKSKNKKRSLGEEAVNGIISVCFFVIAVFLFLSAFAKAGPAGDFSYLYLTKLLGKGYFLLPLIFCLIAVANISSEEKKVSLNQIVGLSLFSISSLGLLSLIHIEYGGVIGRLIDTPLVSLFDTYATIVLLLGALIVSLFINFNTRLKKEHLDQVSSLMKFKKNDGELKIQNEDYQQAMVATNELPVSQEDTSGDVDERKSDVPRPTAIPKIKIAEPEADETIQRVGFQPLLHMLGKPFTPPPMSILEMDRGKPGVGDIKANANIIKRTLQNFGINVEMDEISIGPSVTRYALKPAEGVKLSRILGLQNNLALALAAHPIRIEAPIPGKSLVGIEIPNSVKTTVGLGSLLSATEFQQSDKPLLVALGKGISGKAHFANMAKMPHCLIAGATGSGKSVTIHAIITSLLFRNSPENLRFIMIDPKRVELTLYNGIPHLLTPVITDAKKAILSLKWAAKEMDRRYDILEKSKVRDIDSYHKTILAPALKKLEEKKAKGELNEDESNEVPETMPYIVVVIDELADIMQTFPRELEAGIVRLAQMSRAVGIHLMLSTQRPSVNVITGLIKANVPARIALQVASQIDSRTILDMPGAEKLLGAGDMLYLSGEMSNPQRLQSAFITEVELKKVVKYLIDNYEQLPSEIVLGTNGAPKDPIFSSEIEGNSNMSDEADDDLYEEAREIVMKAGKGSTSYIQRKLSIGYARAARLMDMLEDRGIIGPANGAKPREVIGYDSNPSSDNPQE